LKRCKAFIGRRFTGRKEGNVPIMALRNILADGAFAKVGSDVNPGDVLGLAWPARLLIRSGPGNGARLCMTSHVASISDQRP
jgi:hypothetical protein